MRPVQPFWPAIPQTQLALIGRTDLGANPYTRSLIDTLNNLSEVEGRGQLTADGVVVYDSQGTHTWLNYEGDTQRPGRLFR